jgi:hypothetical protein
VHHILALLVQLASSCVTLLLLVAILAPLEHVFAVRPARLTRRLWSVNLGWYFLNAPVDDRTSPFSSRSAAAGLGPWAEDLTVVSL